ncbi:unnamed protein product, partial [Adineta ricciae]
MSESSLNFSVENGNGQKFYFADLAKKNITSEDLYLWSIPIDIIEEYQRYLESNNAFLSKQFIYNCTLPRFGLMCQYELYYYDQNFSLLNEMIYNYYLRMARNINGLTCYNHLKCNRGYSPACLDWTEICDGKVDCLNGDYDEENCWELELNECKSNEYRCTIGQCIPNEFFEDNEGYSDCVDGSDEKKNHRQEQRDTSAQVPVFRYYDAKCETTFLTSTCDHAQHRTQLIESMFSMKYESASDKCWFAFKCMFDMSSLEYPYISSNTIEKECIPAIRKECPDALYVPNIPSYLGHVYTAYKKNDEPLGHRFIVPYLCSNKSFHDGSLKLVSDISLNNTICFVSPNLSRFDISGSSIMTTRYINTMNNIFQQIKNFNPIINFPLNQCSRFNFYQCINSSKCISFQRLIDGILDCPYNDDETISPDNNPQLFIRIKDKYYYCFFTNKYISKVLIFDKKCDCGFIDSFCEDEHEVQNFTRRIISFQTTCDGFTELSSIIINEQNQTDETNCEQWDCNNIYTRCDEIWNCLDGEDEMGCDISSTIYNCSSNSRICVTLDTYEFRCLPLNQINDGQVDCLGGTDETRICSSTTTTELIGRFYCMGSSPPHCIFDIDLCNNIEDCPSGDDEIFCQKNRSIPSTICDQMSTELPTDIERFFCKLLEKLEPNKEKHKYFRINGFNESLEIKEGRLNNMFPKVTLSDILPLLDKRRCYQGLDLRVWLNYRSNNYTSTCLCPPTYYGKQCQYQNQRISLSLKFHASKDLSQVSFAILILLIDNTNQRLIHSFEQFTYLSSRDCTNKFNMHLLYANRPKHLNKTYSIHIDIYEKNSLEYRGSFIYPVQFLFLPVHRLAFILNIPSSSDHQQQQTCSNDQCQHGKCKKYINEKETFCQCDKGWSGQYCHIPHNCDCSLNSLCIGISSHNRSICLCPKNQFGTRCYLHNRICANSPCKYNGTCIPHDDFMLSKNQGYICLCQNGFSGNRCEIIDTQLNLIFDKNILLSHSVFIHFITIISYKYTSNILPKNTPLRLTALQTISQATNSLRIYWSQPFHLTFIETLDKIYYLTFIQPNYNSSTKIIQKVDSSHRCPSINKLVNQAFAELHLLQRIKSYHFICQKYSPNLLCFHDDIHLCLCYDHMKKRLANCFNFDHNMKFDCFGQSECENSGQCFQDSPDCPKRSICVCRSCYYGNRCQFSTSEFGLSLDAILAYHIIPDLNISFQTSIVKLSLSLTIVFIIIGLINGFLSLITFKNKSVREVGCGIYLFSSSLTTILTMIIFGLKYFVYLSTQISVPSNDLFLRIQCYSLDFLLRICLIMDQYLNACVALERAITIVRSVHFDKSKSKRLAKKIVIILFIVIISTSIHDPIYRRLFGEVENDDKKRIWCTVKYSTNLQIYNRIINTFHFFVPFLINFISSIILITKKSQLQFHRQKDRSYKNIVYREIQHHQHLLIAPVVLCLLALPRLIISYLSK